MGLFVLDRYTGLSVPHGYDGGAFPVGFAVALLAILVVAWGYRDALRPEDRSGAPTRRRATFTSTLLPQRT